MNRERACDYCGAHWRGGWGYFDPTRQREYKFCSRACRGRWGSGVTYSQDEIAAFEQMLPALGAKVAEQGIGEKTFNELSREEALAFAAATVRTFREAFAEVIGSDVPF